MEAIFHRELEIGWGAEMKVPSCALHVHLSDDLGLDDATALHFYSREMVYVSLYISLARFVYMHVCLDVTSSCIIQRPAEIGSSPGGRPPLGCETR